MRAFWPLVSLVLAITLGVLTYSLIQWVEADRQSAFREARVEWQGRRFYSVGIQAFMANQGLVRYIKELETQIPRRQDQVY